MSSKYENEDEDKAMSQNERNINDYLSKIIDKSNNLKSKKSCLKK